MEPQSGQESDEPMYLHIAGPRPEGVEKAKELCTELLNKVKADYEAFKDRPPPSRNYGERDGGFGNGRPGYGDRGDRSERGGGDRDRSQSYGYGGAQGGYGAGAYGATTDATAAVAATPTDQNAAAWDANTIAQYSAWYAQNPESDPYAAYGGFASYMAQYQAYSAAGYGAYYGQPAASAYGQAQSPGPGPGAGAAAPPPPPPTDSYGAPPPPPPAASPGGYSAVRTSHLVRCELG
jgi:hypothetical protein